MTRNIKCSSYFSDALSIISKDDNSDYVTLKKFFEITGNRGINSMYDIVHAFFWFPYLFLNPVFPFGIGIMFIGIRIVFNKPLIPKSILNYKIPKNTVINILKGSSEVLKKFEKIIKPRAQILTRTSS